ncbi:MAG TPA: GSU2403 family nucleotidyltransferase fold protein [Longimicrobium sp.]|nr:GSU2403 family nucleotidyltransferase fold protein [Longimicrobium sp.]
MDDLVALARLVDALRPWLGKLVVVGGWAHRLHRLSPLASAPRYQPVRTLDADLAFSLGEKLQGDIAAALKARDFREQLSGEHTPPVTRYTLGDEAQGFFAEFLTPLTGSGIRRNGTADATVRRAGVTAQKLRHLEVLLLDPITVRLSKADGIPLPEPADVRLANPVSFIAQKLLIHAVRAPAKRPQDVLYIHDTIDLFGARLNELSALWHERIRKSVGRRAANDVERLAGEMFAEVTDVIRSTARIPQDRTLTPEELRARCAYGLEMIFHQR